MMEILEDWCKGCEICIKRCPVQALELSKILNKRGVYPPKLKEDNLCTFCRLCELLCPDFAISVTRDEKDENQEIRSKLIIGGVCSDV